MRITTWQQRARQALGCVLLATGAAQAGAVTSGVGLNLGEWAYWSPDLPSIDQFKRADGWLPQCTRDEGVPGHNANCPSNWAWDTGEKAKLQLDANGWVTRLPAADDANTQYRWVAALLFKDNGSAHPAGLYTVLYDGEGTLEYGLLGSKVSGERGRDIVQVSAGNEGVLIKITATTAGNHVRNLRVLPPGGVEYSNEPWNTAFSANGWFAQQGVAKWGPGQAAST